MAYNPPIGIPNPNAQFGWDIDRASFTRPASWDAGTPGPTAGYYYVDNSNPLATDSGNTYGNPDLPRRTPPYAGNGALSAGNVVYFHGGTYNVGNTGVSSMSICITGTQVAPFWWSGNPLNKPTFEGISLNVGEVANGASYCIIENCKFTNGGSIECRPSGTATGVDHILMRYLEMTGTGSFSDPNGIAIGGGTSAQTTDTVVYLCSILGYGDMTDPTSEQASVYNDFRRARTWILNNTLGSSGADPVAGSHNANDTDALSEYLYVGGNTITTGGENCIDLKSTSFIVISQNICSGLAQREQGWLVLLHSGSNPVPCRNAAIIFNEIHHGTSGIMVTGDGCENLNCTGNLLYDIRASYSQQPDPPYDGLALGLFGLSGTNFVENNTVYGSDRGIKATGALFDIQLRGNIFASITGYTLEAENTFEAYWDSDYNLFPAGATFFWNNASRNLAYLQGTAGVELNSLAGDPDFVNAGADDFQLQSTSPAINTSVEGDGYNDFFSIFGEDIKVDFNDVPRPDGGSWDMGAYEYVGPAVTTLNVTTFRWNTLLVG